MRRLKHIITAVIWIVASIYFAAVILLHIPAIQSIAGKQVAAMISAKLGTEVTFGNVSLGFYNRIIIDDIDIKDQDKKDMLAATRISAKFDFIRLFKGKIAITSAQLFGLNAKLSKKNQEAKPNFQFVLDSLASKDTTSHTPLDLEINSLVIRRGRIKYDQLDVPVIPNDFNSNSKHLDIEGLSGHFIVNKLTDDSINVNVRKLSLKEKAGFELKSLTFKFLANKQTASVQGLRLELPHSLIALDSIQAVYRFDGNRLQIPTLEYQGSISPSIITPSDLSYFTSSLKNFRNPITLSSDFSGTSTSIRIKNLQVGSKTNSINLQADGSVSNWDSKARWAALITHLRMSAAGIKFVTDNLGQKFEIPVFVTRLGNIHFQGNVGGYGADIAAKGILHTEAGNANVAIGKHNRHFSGRVETQGLNLKQILADNKFGHIATRINVDGTLPANKHQSPLIKAKGDISQFTYNSYTYRDITVDGTYHDDILDGLFRMDDPNGRVDVKGKLNLSAKSAAANLTAHVTHLNPSALKISNRWPGAVFGFDLKANVTGKNLNTAKGTVDLDNFSMTAPENNYQLAKLHIDLHEQSGVHNILMSSDFGHVDISGQYDYNTIAQSLTNLVGSKLPTLPGLPKLTSRRTNNFVINATIEQSDWLQQIFNIPINLRSPLTVKGFLDDKKRETDIVLQASDFSYGNHVFEKGYLHITTPEDTLRLNAHVRKLDLQGHGFYWNVQAAAADNTLKTAITFNNKSKNLFKGQVNAESQFYKNPAGVSTAHVNILPSHILVGDSTWQIKPSEIYYSQNHLDVRRFLIERNGQHLLVYGTATKNRTDSLTAELKDLDISYLLNLVNFHAVSFGGLATGKACVSSVFSKPEARAELMVNDFTFENGRMGVLEAKVNYDNKKGQIDISALANDTINRSTLIAGYVSPQRNYIDLDITARNTRAEFIESFCGSFMRDTDLSADGTVKLYGPLDNINLVGELVANGSLWITPLNTRYWLKNDIIRMVPDEIVFSGDNIYDRNGNLGIVQGKLKHQHLTNLSYDLNIAADNLLAYDFPTYGDEVFYGRVYATGNCAIKGKSGEVSLDINVTPEKNSFIEYNAASPDAISSNEFIHWSERDSLGDDGQSPDGDSIKENHRTPEEDDFVDIPTDIRLNFLINCTPDATLRVLMDKQSGDKITLNGNGVIRATYYNKGAFDMYGTYLVDHGSYGLTIQNAIRKNFQFNQGGTIVFGGDPYNATLNLQAQHIVSGVSLSDLNIGRSFSNNNIRVNCLMNISGTPGMPKIDFNFDLPTVNSDAKQMIYSLINSEEEMNQQVLYLLAIGRFYSQTGNNAAVSGGSQQSQTSLAMQSLLSGQITQQLNNMLSTVVKNTNWNLGANISTGDEGWNNAEYEGLLSGRMLNNRLLFNGQFGYRDNANATTSFIGDFDLRYLLFPNGNFAIRVYNQTNDRYFTRNSLTTQGLGLILKKDFNGFRDLFGWKRKKKVQLQPDTLQFKAK